MKDAILKAFERPHWETIEGPEIKGGGFKFNTYLNRAYYEKISEDGSSGETIILENMVSVKFKTSTKYGLWGGSIDISIELAEQIESDALTDIVLDDVLNALNKAIEDKKRGHQTGNPSI